MCLYTDLVPVFLSICLGILRTVNWVLSKWGRHEFGAADKVSVLVESVLNKTINVNSEFRTPLLWICKSHRPCHTYRNCSLLLNKELGTAAGRWVGSICYGFQGQDLVWVYSSHSLQDALKILIFSTIQKLSIHLWFVCRQRISINPKCCQCFRNVWLKCCS